MTDETTATVELSTEQRQELTAVETLGEKLERYTVQTVEQYTGANDQLKLIKAKANELSEMRFSITRPLDAAKQRVMDLFKPAIDKLAKAEGAIKRAMISFQNEQEKIRQEAERKLQERARKEEEARKKALEERAAKAEEKGKTDKAEELREKAAQTFVPMPTVESQTPKLNGTKTVKVWKFKIADQLQVPRDYLMVDEKKIGAVVRASKGTIKIEGVEVYSEDVLSTMVSR